jgi:hypothetical protein
MPSSKDPAATQEFKISALPPEAAEDSALISALTKLVNEVYASAEDGLGPRTLGDSTGEFGMQAHRAQPSGHRHRDGNLPDSASRKHATRDAALCSFRIYQKTSGPAPRLRLKNPGPSTETDFPGSVMCERLISAWHGCQAEMTRA